MVNWNRTVRENEKSSQQAKTRGGLPWNQGRDENQRPVAKNRPGAEWKPQQARMECTTMKLKTDGRLQHERASKAERNRSGGTFELGFTQPTEDHAWPWNHTPIPHWSRKVELEAAGLRSNSK
jgi:hypothetical protein